MDEFSKCNKNLESLFVQITNTTAPWYVGVFYRPPSGSKSEAIAELEKLMPCLLGWFINPKYVQIIFRHRLSVAP